MPSKARASKDINLDLIKPERIYDWIDQFAHFVVVPSKRQWVDGLAF